MIDMSRNMMYHITNLNTQSERISYQMATGKAQDKGSEDSVMHSKIINLEDKIRVTEGLKLQIEKTRALNDTSDINIAETKTSLESIKLDIMKALNDGMDRSDKLALATNLKGIREGIIDMVNTNIDGEYIFSGSVTTNVTLSKDNEFELNGKVEFGGDGFLREVAVAPGSYRDRGVTAYDVIFYNASSASAGETFTFSEGERIIDENGNEWKLNATKDYLQQYDKNGNLSSPIIEISASIPSSNSIKVDLGIGTNADASGDYNIVVDGTTYTYTAGGADDAATVFASLKASIEADGYTVSASLENDDQFTIHHSSNITVSVSNTDPNYNTVATNEQEVSGSSIAIPGTFSVNIPTEPAGRLLEAKHNYFDDLNVIINALEGYGTALDGTKSIVIDNAQVDNIMKEYLGRTTTQYDYTNIGHGELGGRNSVFEVSYEKLESQLTQYNIFYQETAGADLAKLAMESKSLELTYQSLYSTIAKMNQLSLINFLK